MGGRFDRDPAKNRCRHRVFQAPSAQRLGDRFLDLERFLEFYGAPQMQSWCRTVLPSGFSFGIQGGRPRLLEEQEGVGTGSHGELCHEDLEVEAS